MNTIWMRKPVHQGVGMRYTVCRKAMAVLLSLLMLLSCVGCGLGKTASETTWGRADAKEIDVNSKVAGRVVELLVKEGDTVEAGQVIARIDKRSLEAQKTELEASIEAVRAQQSQAAVTTNMQQGATQSALSQAQSAADRARADLALAKADHDRYANLLAQGAVSQQTFDQYDTKYKTAQAAYEQAQGAVSQSNAGLLQTDVSKENEKALAAKLAQAEASLQDVEVSLDETEIKAPFDGVITEKYVEKGSMISNGTPLVAVQDTSDNWVDIKIPGTQLSDFHLGQQVTLIGRDNKTKVTGTVTDISKRRNLRHSALRANAVMPAISSASTSRFRSIPMPCGRACASVWLVMANDWQT